MINENKWLIISYNILYCHYYNISYVFAAFIKDGFESQNPSFQCFIAKTRKEGNFF